MVKTIRVNSKIIVILENGVILEKDNIDEVFLKELEKCETTEDYYSLINPEYKEKKLKRDTMLDLTERVKNSKLLTLKGMGIYYSEISNLSVPMDLAVKILDAEDAKDEILLETYKNFWTLLSLNTDEECRTNLFWFLSKWGLRISRSGFFVAYRNVDIKEKKEPYIESIFTDHHTHTFDIKIGKMVTMPREDCDSNSNVSCSRGLHCANAGWLEKNYFGNQGLVVLVNPAEVCAVPPIENYGKLRCCAYLPIALAEFGKDNHIIPYKCKDGFECYYVNKVIYEGLMGTEKDTKYKINIPEIPGITKESIADKLLEIAKQNIINREI